MPRPPNHDGVGLSILNAPSGTVAGMAKKQSSTRRHSRTETVTLPAITEERFTRLYRLLHLLGKVSRRREWLIKQLNLDVRGFYRDLEFLRTVGIKVGLDEGGYHLAAPVKDTVSRLPFPDLHLTVGEVRQLAHGKLAVHRRVRKQIAKLEA
jgi:hypothetical protein